MWVIVRKMTNDFYYCGYYKRMTKVGKPVVSASFRDAALFATKENAEMILSECKKMGDMKNAVVEEHSY